MRTRLLLAAACLAALGSGGIARASASASGGPAAAMRALALGDPSLAGSVRTLFEGSGWAVVQSTRAGRASAFAFHFSRGLWLADRSRRVTVAILGPQPGARVPARPQVAIEITAKRPFVESALWVDGTELQEKGGGSPTNGTIYGAPAGALRPGVHVAVGFARTAASGSAVAWLFRVA